MIEYNFCPRCGAAITSSSEPAHCRDCDVTYYRNAKPCASVLPVKDGKVLLARRGKEPYLGAYDIIGGFMEVDELPEAAALREAMDDVAELEWVAIEDVPLDEGFQNTRDGLRDLKEWFTRLNT